MVKHTMPVSLEWLYSIPFNNRQYLRQNRFSHQIPWSSRRHIGLRILLALKEQIWINA
ncbi:hypothetical protein OH492_27100 [Vibrio chagasii]|nr:hypothetical protein [Vibrio chagasii]